MSCNVSLGYKLPCKNDVGGFKAMYIANFDDYAIVAASSASGHEITSLGTLAAVHKYDLKNSGNSYVETVNSSRDNGTTSYNQVMTAVLTGINKELDFQLKMMSYGNPIVFVEMSSGKVLCMGLTQGAELAGTLKNVAGTLEGAVNATLTLTANEPEPSFLLNASSVTALKALVGTQID